MPPWHGYMPPPPGSLNHYRNEARRRDANQRAALAIVVEQLTIASSQLQYALERLDHRRAANV